MASTAPRLPAGEVLQRARLARRIELERAATDTRIAAEYLQALEDDVPLQSFPQPVYAKFFLREYAEYLHLDPDRMVASFTRAYGPVDPGPTTLVPPKYAYAAFGEEAIRVPTGITPGRQLPIPRALVPNRRKAIKAPRAEALDDTRPQLRMERLRRSRSKTIAIAGLIVLSIPATALGMLWDRGGSGNLRTAGVGSGAASAPTALPLGGKTIFPTYRVVAFYGAPSTQSLGILGIGPQQAAAKLLLQSRGYRRGHRPVLPAFELIATVASTHPGPDGKYRNRQNPLVIQQYLDAARDVKALTVLDIQPGRSDFMTEVRAYEGFLKQPDVGLALDPEWLVGPKEVPGRVIGSVDAAEVNQVIDYLSGLVKQYHLPQKLLIVHQFTNEMIRHRALVRTPPQLAVTFDVDGVGGAAAKKSKYQEFSSVARFHYGIKLYYEQDVGLMRPLDVLNLYPPPELVVYQ